jgi:hypothetical protein
MYNVIYNNLTVYGVLLGIDEGLNVLNGLGALGSDCIKAV